MLHLTSPAIKFGQVSLLFFVSLFISAQEGNVYEGSVEALDSFQTVQLSELKGRPTLWYFFQPNCPSCLRQKEALACLPPTTNLLAVGVLGNKSQLIKEAQRHSLKGRWLYAGGKSANPWKVQQTPTILIVNSSGKIVFRKNSLAHCEEMKTTLEKLQ